MAQVILKNICKTYEGGAKAVNDVSLTVNDREFMVIVGPSGCGKTTTLRMIAGLEDITSGTISIGDKIVNDIAAKDRDIAMVFQNYALYPHMSVYDNMAFGLKLRKIPKDTIRRCVNDTAKLLGIESYLDRKPKALSGGQRQRVALGRAIVRNPKAFLFDEPLSNLDAKLRVTTRAELKSLHQRLGTTSIYVTHDQAEAMTLGDRICVMYDGKIQQVASPMEIYDNPANRFVAGFLGTPPMNFLNGRIIKQGGLTNFVFGQEEIVLPERLRKKLDGMQDSEFTLGIRPEALTVKASHIGNEKTLRLQVDIIEPLGDHMDVYFRSLSGHKIIANMDPHTKIKSGELVELAIDTNKIYVFELGLTGKNIYI